MRVDYKGLQGVARVEWVALSYRGLQGVTRDYRR